MKASTREWLHEVFLHTSDRGLAFLLTFLVVMMFVVYPFFQFEGPGRYLMDVFMALVLISGVFAIGSRGLRWFALALAVFSLVTRWVSFAQPKRELFVANLSLTVAFLALASGVILLRVFAPGAITRARIQGAVAVYLLLGLLFAYVFVLTELVSPGAFAMAAFDPSGNVHELYDRLMGRFSYFSFITLTTVGYGDVTPIHPIARQAAVLEGLIGQLYPAILLARLVSMELSQASSGSGN